MGWIGGATRLSGGSGKRTTDYADDTDGEVVIGVFILSILFGRDRAGTRFLRKLETTTIYTKVAVLRQQQIQSPLDVLNGKAPPHLVERKQPSVGRMRIDLRPITGQQAAGVKLTILSDDRFIHLDGIVVREPRPGWVSLEVPPLESWCQPLSWLTPPQRERIESPEFYEVLRKEVGKRFLALSSPSRG